MQQADYTVTHLDETLHMHMHMDMHSVTYLPHWCLLIHHRSPCNTTTHTDLSYIKYAILYKIYSYMHTI